jgi:hypothetical protein
MKKYPTVITDEILANLSKHSDEDIAKDITETEYEIGNLERLEEAEREVARVHPSHSERRLAEFRADARIEQRRQRQEFIDFLKRVQEARSARSIPSA